MTINSLPPAIYAALATRALAPDVLCAYQVTGDDVFLYLVGGVAARVEVSALPAHYQDLGPCPYTTVKADCEPEHAEAQPVPEGGTRTLAPDLPPKGPEGGVSAGVAADQRGKGKKNLRVRAGGRSSAS